MKNFRTNSKIDLGRVFSNTLKIRNLFFVFVLLSFNLIFLSGFSQITRTQMINNATPYESFSWFANSCNLWNGTSCSGANIYHAPWTSTGSNTSMPYCWGGWSTQSEYNTAMSNCKSAGQVCSASGGGCTGLPSAPLSCAGGHDCSGLVTRAWGLTTKYSTSTLPNISSSIAASSVQAGDIFNIVGSHTRLVYTNNGSTITVLESSGTDWKCAYHTYTPAQLASYDARCPNSSVLNGGCGIVAPPNDNCPGTTLAVNSSCNYTSGDLSGATTSIPAILCDGSTSNYPQDVWYNFYASSTGTYQIILDPSSGLDGVVSVYSSGCTNPAIDCQDIGGGAGQNETLNVALTGGQTYYVRVYHYGISQAATTTTFNICVTASAGTPNLIPTSGQYWVSGSSTVNAGSFITANCSEDNNGTSMANGSNTVALWLCQTSVLNSNCSNATYLGSIAGYSNVAAGANTIAYNTSVQIPCNIASGVYYLFFWVDGCGSSCSGCTGVITESSENDNFASVPITILGNNLLVSASHTNASCNGVCNGTLTANGSGGAGSYSYSWSGGLGTGQTKSNVCAGIYTVTITDGNGCTNTATTTVTQPNAINVSASATNATCFGANNGTLTANASGGSGSLIYLWSGGLGTGQTKSNVPAGTYTVTVTDGNGCTNTASATVTQPNQVNVSVNHTNLNCFGICDGTLSANANGGTGSFNYTWSNGLGAGQNKTSVCPGTYTVTATDANGCSNTATATITQPTQLFVTTTFNNPSCSTCCDGSATANPSGGTPNYSYSWSSVSTSQTAFNLCNGAYTVTVTDANGCTRTDLVNFSVGINEQSISEFFKIFPNPTNDFIFVKGSALENIEFKITITNELGQEIKKQLIKATNHKIETKFDIRKLSSGTYFVNITINNSTAVFKIQKL